ncbi:hypothetical protein C7212DRAFT_362848 [Tuber magnatum]|uniref:Uncharacterized protein n=1 Tax=Tuber magnatum TaxID=42249 RepID=A0A317SVP9_9PEZI|nr:hypothetical protein C7212DRAFT_362848 [Tuber magnatum]
MHYQFQIAPRAGIGGSALQSQHDGLARMLAQSDHDRQSEHMYHVAGLAWQQEVRQAQHEELRGDARRTEEKVDALVAWLDLFRRDEDHEREIRHRKRVEALEEARDRRKEERVEALEEAWRDDDRRMEERVEARAVRLDNAGAKADACGGIANIVQEPERNVLAAQLDNVKGKVDTCGERVEAIGALADPGMDRTWPDLAPVRGIVSGYLLCASWLPGLLSSRQFRQGVCVVALAVYLLLCLCVKRPGQGVEIEGVEIHATTTASLVGPTPRSLANQPSPQHIHNHNLRNPKTAPTAGVPFRPLNPVLSNRNGATGHLDSLPNKNILHSILKGPMPSSRSGTHAVIAAFTLIIRVQALRIHQ